MGAAADHSLLESQHEAEKRGKESRSYLAVQKLLLGERFAAVAGMWAAVAARIQGDALALLRAYITMVERCLRCTQEMGGVLPSCQEVGLMKAWVDAWAATRGVR